MDNPIILNAMDQLGSGVSLSSFGVPVVSSETIGLGSSGELSFFEASSPVEAHTLQLNVLSGSLQMMGHQQAPFTLTCLTQGHAELNWIDATLHSHDWLLSGHEPASTVFHTPDFHAVQPSMADLTSLTTDETALLHALNHHGLSNADLDRLIQSIQGRIDLLSPLVAEAYGPDARHEALGVVEQLVHQGLDTAIYDLKDSLAVASHSAQYDMVHGHLHHGAEGLLGSLTSLDTLFTHPTEVPLTIAIPLDGQDLLVSTGSSSSSISSTAFDDTQFWVLKDSSES